MADPWPEGKVDLEEETAGVEKVDGDVETQSVSSTTSYATANDEDEVFTHSDDDLGDLIDLNPSPVDLLASTDDINTRLAPTGFPEMIEVDRLLS